MLEMVKMLEILLKEDGYYSDSAVMNQLTKLRGAIEAQIIDKKALDNHWQGEDEGREPRTV
jgi:hypothetical protein